MSVAELLQERTARPARTILREWIRDYLDDKDEVRVEEIVASAYAKFANDDEFVEAMLADGIAILVTSISNEIFGANRKAMVPTSIGGVTREKLEIAENRFARMFENAGNGRHVSLLAMKRPELRTAIEQRTADIEGRARHLSFLRDVEAGMKNDHKPVGDVFSQSRLESLWRKHNES